VYKNRKIGYSKDVKYIGVHRGCLLWLAVGFLFISNVVFAATNVCLNNFPSYKWYYGCFGTASGILMGYWDRNGFPDLYTGPMNGGVMPVSSAGFESEVYCFWATRAGYDGRSATNYGHVDDYYIAYESMQDDPWHSRGYEHPADCIGDFMGLNQKRWTNMNNECDGNIDAYAFNYFDTSGAMRVNFIPSIEAGAPARDIQSGLKAFAEYRGCVGDSFSQLADVWQYTPAGTGFTFDDFKAEIDAGRPVLFMLQQHASSSVSNFNPSIHGVPAYGYRTNDVGNRYVRFRTGWSASTGDYREHEWNSESMISGYSWMYLRGVIGFRPKIQMVSMTSNVNRLHFSWNGSTVTLWDDTADEEIVIHGYVVEGSTSLVESAFTCLSPTTTTCSITLTNVPDDYHYFRIRHVRPE
jgi:hypothetical protein